MYFIAVFALGMIGFSIYMVLKPTGFADLIIGFCQKPWFHPFEIVTRATIGAVFLLFAKDTGHPQLFTFLGYLLLAVSLGLLLLGAKRHRAFGVKSAEIGRKYFRLAGIVATPLGVWLLLIALNV